MKTFKELREMTAPKNVRSPLDKQVFNQHLLMKYKLSIPTEDNNLFNAENVPIKAGKHIGVDNEEDQSDGYTAPIVFGAYLNRLLDMRSEGIELSDEETSILDESLNLDEEAFIALCEKHIEIDIEDDDDEDEESDEHEDSESDEEEEEEHDEKKPVKEEALDELSKKTLGSYVKAAAADMANREAIGFMNKAGSDTQKMHFKKSDKRERGVNKAVDKLTKEEVEVIDELNKSTLERYSRKAKTVVDSSKKEHEKERQKVIKTDSSSRDYSKLNKIVNTYIKRDRGLGLAKKKLDNKKYTNDGPSMVGKNHFTEETE